MTKKQTVRRFENDTLALPPLRMVLVHAGTQHRVAWVKKSAASGQTWNGLDRRRVVLRLIEHLSQKE